MVQTLKLLRWLYLGRLTLAAGIFAGALFVLGEDTVATALVATLALLLAVTFTVVSFWWTEILGRAPGTNFLYAQSIFDTLLVTAVVHITGQDGISPFPPLYILVIATGALTLPLPGGMLIGALASILYFAEMVWLHPDPPEAVALLQIVLFAAIALVTGALGDRLRRTGVELGAMESALRQLRLDTNEMLAAIDTALLTVDGEGRLSYANDAAVALLSLDPDAWRTRSVLPELDRRAPGLGTVIQRTAKTGVPIRRYEIRRRTATSDRYLGVRTTVLTREGQPWVTAVIQDNTETKRIEELLRRAERLQAVAELGASLAHEIKNPLASLRSAAEQLAASVDMPAADREVLRRLVVNESQRLSRLLTDFMEFSGYEANRWGNVDLTEVVEEALELVRQHPAAGNGVRLEVDRPAEPLMVDGDRDLLHRALFNLLLNAVQHSGPDGRVLVEVGPLAQGALPEGMAMRAPVRLSVRDSGPGIEEAEAARIFDPFYTTREGGTGLGLALVHRAVEAHSGSILVDGRLEDGPGARFTVYLPAKAPRGKG